MSQLTISFDAPHNHTATSRAAAARLSSTSSGRVRRHADLQRILATLEQERWGLTCDELEQRLGLSHQTASARVRDLVKAGRIFHHGERATRTGCAARVYFVKKA